MTINEAKNCLLARVSHVTYKINPAGRVVDRKPRKAVMIIGVFDNYALVRWVSHSSWDSFKISLDSLLPY